LAIKDYSEWYVYKSCPTCGKMGRFYDEDMHNLCLHLEGNAHKFLSEDIEVYEGCYVSNENQKEE